MILDLDHQAGRSSSGQLHPDGGDVIARQGWGILGGLHRVANEIAQDIVPAVGIRSRNPGVSGTLGAEPIEKFRKAG